MTEFQKFLQKNPKSIMNGAFEKFKDMYPELTKQAAKSEFNKQVSEVFFRGKQK
jgi:hypothetical protein